MKIRNILFLAVLSVSVLSCTLTRRMERRGTAAALSLMQKRKLAPADSLSENGRHPGEGWVRRPNGDSLYWAGTLVDKDGERRMLIRLDEVRVVGRSKVVVERMGLVTLDFRITVPEQLQGNSLGIVVTPRLHDGDSIVKLERLVVRGGLYGRLQERDLWQFGRYRERMTTLMRNAGDSLRESVLDRAYRRIVRFPRTSGARLDSVVKERERIDYYYTQQVRPRSGSKQLVVTLEGEVRGLDGSRYELPPSDTLRYTVSSMLSLIDTLPRFCIRVIDKYAVVRDRNYIAFRVNGTRTVRHAGRQPPAVGADRGADGQRGRSGRVLSGQPRDDGLFVAGRLLRTERLSGEGTGICPAELSARALRRRCRYDGHGTVDSRRLEDS